MNIRMVDGSTNDCITMNADRFRWYATNPNIDQNATKNASIARYARIPLNITLNIDIIVCYLKTAKKIATVSTSNKK